VLHIKASSLSEHTPTLQHHFETIKFPDEAKILLRGHLDFGTMQRTASESGRYGTQQMM
jgi:hypothetical protein